MDDDHSRKIHEHAGAELGPRQQGVRGPAEVEWGIIDPNGKFSVVKMQEKET